MSTEQRCVVFVSWVLCCFVTQILFTPLLKVLEICSECCAEGNLEEDCSLAELCEKMLNANRFLTLAQGYYISYAL